MVNKTTFCIPDFPESCIIYNMFLHNNSQWFKCVNTGKMLKSSKDTQTYTFFVGEWVRSIEVLQLYVSQLNPIRLVTVIHIYSS